MNEPIVFVGPNKRVTPLEVEAHKSGFKPIQVCAFDFQYHYSARKILEMLNTQDKPVLFRFIYPFYDYTFREKTAKLESDGIDAAAAERRVFESMIQGWKQLVSRVKVPTIEVNKLDALIKQKNKAFQYRTLLTHMKHAVPGTIFLDEGEQIHGLLEMLDRCGGLVYKPVCGSRSQGIVIVKKHPAGYLFQSDIKFNRVSQVYTGDIEEKLLQMHNPNYVVQEMLKFSDTYAGRDYDIRVHVIDGRVTGTAAFVFNPELKDDEVHSLDLAARQDPRIHKAHEEAKEMSIEAARLFDLDVSGIDLIITDEFKVQITEVNSFPGWRTQLDLDPDFDIAREEVAFYERLLR